MSFQPLSPRETAVDACAAALRRAILSGELAPGDRLPPERRLAEQFAVNRVTVRSAIGRLTTERLLAVRQGSGTVVRDFRRSGGPELIPGLAQLAKERAHGDPAELVSIARDLLSVRRALAQMVFDLLAERGVTDRAQVKLSAAVDALARAAESSAPPEVIADRDLAVLEALLDATGSAVLRLCMNPVVTVVQEWGRIRDILYADPATNVAAYRLLLAWCAAPDRRSVPLFVQQLVERDEQTLEALGQPA